MVNYGPNFRQNDGGRSRVSRETALWPLLRYHHIYDRFPILLVSYAKFRLIELRYLLEESFRHGDHSWRMKRFTFLS